MLLYDTYTTINGEKKAVVAHGFTVLREIESFDRPMIDSESNVIKFAVNGKNYNERKACVEEIAKDFQWQDSEVGGGGLSYGEYYAIQKWFEKQARKYGLLKVFRREGII